MALVLKDRVRETTTTTGTGTVTLGGAVAGFQAFSVVGNANTCYYTIVGTTEWEVGIGTYTLSGTTLSRDTILESSNAGAAVSFSAGSKDVFLTYPAERAVATDFAQTISNKRITPRVINVGSSATITPTGDTADQYNVTAQATAATIATPSGTPVDGQKLILRIEDNGTARALTWTTTAGAYRAVGVTLPTTTVVGATTYVGCIYNAFDTFWDVISVAQGV